jgi:hypothetical protein
MAHVTRSRQGYSKYSKCEKCVDFANTRHKMA